MLRMALEASLLTRGFAGCGWVVNRGGSPHPVFLSFMRVLFLVYYVNEPAPKNHGASSVRIMARDLDHGEKSTTSFIASLARVDVVS